MSMDQSKYYNRRVRLQDRRNRHSRQFEPVRDDVHGTVFSIGGDIFADRAGNYVWVHEWGINASQEQAYLPPHLNVFDGAGVRMWRSPKYPHELEITRVHFSPYPRAVADHATTDIRRGSIGVHGINHWYPTEATKGPDPVLVWHSAIQIFKSVATETDLTVQVGPLTYGVGASRTWFPATSGDDVIDLTSYLPAAGNAVRVLIYLDTVTGLLDVVSSAESAIPANPPYPDTPAGGIASAYFYLEDTYTTLSMVNDYLDARRWLTETTGLPAPTEEGQLLFANSDLSWVTGKIVTSGGDVVVSDGDVVWST